MKNKLIYWITFCTLLGLFLPMITLAESSSVGVSYRGHIQDLGDYPADGSWVDSPKIIGTVGQSKRIEGFEIKLTGTVPDGMELRYNVHVQNKGWLYDEDDSSDWPKDGAYAGTQGDSLRIEAVKIVLTDSDGKPVPGYSVQYRGHVQNIGDLPADGSQWLADGTKLGTVGSSLRLEALLVTVVQVGQKDADLSDYTALLAQIDKLNEADYTVPTWVALQNAVATHPVTVKNSQTEVDAAVAAIQAAYNELEKKTEPAEPLVYDKAATFGPKQGSETIAGDVIVAADGVVLQNLVIQGTLTISEAVGDGNVTLNNVTVKGDTFVRGGGVNSIKINGGEYSRIVMEKTASGAVRIVAKDVNGCDVVISEAAAGETIILEGAFESVTVNAPNMTVITQGETTTIGKMMVGEGAGGTTLNLASGTTVTDLTLDAKTAVKGQGTVTWATINADSVVFEKAPGTYSVKPEVVIPPVFPTPDSGGSGGGGPTTIAVFAVSLNKNTATLNIGTSETLIATVAPAGATNKTVSWESSDKAVATVNPTTGLVTAVAVGTAKVTVTTADGNKQASCDVTVEPIAVTGVSLNQQNLNLVYDETAKLTATVEPANATNKAISFSSSNPAVAIVDATNGEITTFGAGTATITVTTADGSFSTSCEVTVQGRLSITQVKAVAGLTDNYVSLLLEGDTFTSNSFVFDPGTTGLALGSPTSDSNHYAFALNNTAYPGTLTLQATGLTSGVNSTTVTITVLPAVTAFANTAFDDTTASFSWPALEGATAVSLQQQKNGDPDWTAASCLVNPESSSTTATVTGLAPATTYQFRLVVTGGTTPRVSNLVNVTTKPVATSVSLDKSTADLTVGNNLYLTATVLPTDAINKTISWTSDQPDFATVDTTGKVTGVAPGTAVIKATTANSLVASCTVLVKPVFEATTTTTEATISAYNGTDTIVNIPELIDGKPVTSIGANAFKGKTTMTIVTIPATVTSIGANAFQGSGITSLDLGNVAIIDDNAFNECTALTTLMIPNTVTHINYQAFANCLSLKSVIFKGGATSMQTLGSSVFWQCIGLETVDFEANTKINTLSLNTFFLCISLKRVSFSDALSTIEGSVFSGCPPTLVLRFDGNAPSNTANSMPAGTTIEYWEGKTGFNAAPWNDNINYTLKLRNASLTQTAVTINTASFSFEPQTGAAAVKLQQKASTDGDWSDAITTEPLTTASTFATATGLLPATNYVFRLLVSGGDNPGPSQMVSLTTVVAVSAVTLNTNTLELSQNGSDTLTATVTPAEAANKNLTWTTSNSAVGTVDAGLVTAKSAGTATITATAADGSGTSASCIVTVLPYDTSGITELTITKYRGSATIVTIPETIGGKPVVAIGTSAFETNSSLTTVSIPGSIKSIDDEAFYYCRNLNTVNFAEGSDDLVIGKGAFWADNGITTINLPKRLKIIEERAFDACENLATVNFATDCRLISIAKSGFAGCPITTIDLPDQLQTIGYSVFYNNQLTGTLKIPAALTEIGENAFQRNVTGGTPLTTLIIDDGTGLSIGRMAFNYHAFETITIPDDVIINDFNVTMGTTGADFRALYLTGGAGTYAYDSSTNIWTKN